MDISLLIKSKIEKLCQCAVCLELLKQPRTLVCQHTFCQKCLMLTCVANRMGLMSLFCPTCRQRQPLVFRSSDVTKLQVPYFLNQVLEILNEWTMRSVSSFFIFLLFFLKKGKTIILYRENIFTCIIEPMITEYSPNF